MLKPLIRSASSGALSRQRATPAVAAMVGALVLAACSSSPGAQMVVPSFGAFAKTSLEVPAGGGAAVLGVEFVDLGCADVRVVVGRAGPTGFAPVRTATIASQFGNGVDSAVVPLAAGDYHLLQVACRNGTNVSVVGANDAPGSIPWQGTGWPQALGSFTIVKGRAADLGLLSVSRRRSKGFEQNAAPPVVLSHGGRSDASTARLASSQPELAGRLQPAPFALAAPQGLVLAKCKLTASAEAESAAKSAPLPSGDATDTLQGLTVKEPPASSCQPVAAGGGLGG